MDSLRKWFSFNKGERVAITVTPANGYYFTNDDLTVEPVTDAGNAMARRRTAPESPGYAEAPTVNAGQNNTLTFSCTATDAYTAPFPYADGGSFTNLSVNSTITCTAGKAHIAGLIALQTGVTSIESVSAVVNITSKGGGDLYPASSRGSSVCFQRRPRNI